jgi:hypothetical protein
MDQKDINTGSPKNSIQSVIPKKILTLKEKKELQNKKIKQIYGFDISGDAYLVFEDSLFLKKNKIIPGVLYIKNKGILVGSYKTRSEAMKFVKLMESHLITPTLQKLRLYKVFKISTGIRTNIITEGLRSIK